MFFLYFPLIVRFVSSFLSIAFYYCLFLFIFLSFFDSDEYFHVVYVYNLFDVIHSLFSDFL